MNQAFLFISTLFLLCYFLIPPYVNPCTLVVVGKKATTDGSTLVAHTEDSGGQAIDIRLVTVPAMDHAPNATRNVYSFVRSGYPRVVTTERGPAYMPVNNQELSTPVGTIPQVSHTYGYIDQDYGLINEKQLSIGESTCAAKTVGWPRTAGPHGKNLFGIEELSKIALERCDTARCAVQTMGDLAVKYGFYSDYVGNTSHPMYSSSAESLGVADKYGEAWVFHVLTGPNHASAVWAAQRVPDAHIAVIANGFIIRQMNLTDSDNYLASDNIHSFAKEMGWWKPENGPFDFTAAYGYMDKGPLLPLYVGRRIWRIYDVFAPSLHLDATLGYDLEEETYPFSIQPDNRIRPLDLMNILRDYYEGTEFDLTKGIDAGPFGNPIRNGGSSSGVTGGWERAISLERTLFSFVLQARSDLPDEVGGINWYGLSSPHGTIYLPFSCNQKELPEAYHTGTQTQFHPNSAWWAFNFINNWMQLRYQVIYPEVRKNIDTLQENAIQTEQELRHKALAISDKAEREIFIQKQLNEYATKTIQTWWTFAWHLVSKYSSGSVSLGEDPGKMKASPYPKWWLEATSYPKWPGKSYYPISMRKKDALAKQSHFTFYFIIFGGLTAVVALSGYAYMKYNKRATYHPLA